MAPRMNAPRVHRRFEFRVGGWVYLAVTLFMGAAAFNSQTNLLFWTFGLMLGALTVTVALGVVMSWGVRVKRVLPDHGAVDEPLVIRYEMVNRNRVVPAFGLGIVELDTASEEGLSGRPHGWVLHVGPQASIQAESIGWPVRRGAVHFSRIAVGTTFPFGIFRRVTVFTQPGRVVIYPRLHRIRRELLENVRCHDPAGSRFSQQGGGHEEFFGLREYRSGDSIRSIDWKHSARFGQLVSRDFTRLTPPRVMVILDLRGGDDEHRERAISFGASLVCQAHLEGFEVGLAVAGVAAPVFAPARGRHHRTRVLHTLGELDVRVAAPGLPSLGQLRQVNWVVIHAMGVDRSLGGDAAIHLGPDDLGTWKADGSVEPAEKSDQPEVGEESAPEPEGVGGR